MYMDIYFAYSHYSNDACQAHLNDLLKDVASPKNDT